MRYFLAGGAVRDLLLGLSPVEFDIVFDGSPEDMARHHGSVRRVGKTAATYIADGRDHVPLADSISEDLLARDCTINALLMDENGIIHALPRTFEDLRNGTIRHASPDAFRKDPARVFRAARFTATLPGFSIAEETVPVMRAAAARPEFAAIAAERVGKECMKAMAGHTPGNFLRALAAANALAPWLTPLGEGKNIPAGPQRFHGANTVLDHTVAVMNDVARDFPETSDSADKAERALGVWMALCHDLGKLTTPHDLLPRHIGHEFRGQTLAETLARRLRLPRRWEKAGILAAALHMKAGQYTILRPGTKVDLLHTLAVNRVFAPFMALVMADAEDRTLGDAMRRDMAAMHAVSLPAKWRNKGVESAAELRRLRSQAVKLSALSR